MDEKLCYMTLFVKLLISQLSTMTAGEPCERGEFLASGRALKNHIFKSVVVRSALDCHFLCKNDKKCNSYNFMITGNICELSNSTKEARPHDFLHDEAGLYMGIRPVAGYSSCQETFNKLKVQGNKDYLLQLPSGKIRVYCHMSVNGLGACNGGGWTLVMKIDGHKRTFHYNSSLWSNKDEFNVNSGQGLLDDNETKLPTYWNTPFTKICLGMKVRNSTNFIFIAKKSSSMHALIADGKYRHTSLGRETWKSLIGSKGSLQPQCNMEGFNAKCTENLSKARIGIIGNNEQDCDSCDSRIGFGTGGYPDDSNTCGNEAKHLADKGDQHIKAMGYILVQ